MPRENLDSAKILKIAKLTFNTDKPTAEQIKYVMTMQVPSLYLLAHHFVNGHPITFNVPNRDVSKAPNHRPLKLLGAL